MTRPSDRAIAQAFAEFQDTTIAVPVGHYDDTKGSSTYNWRRSFESAVLDRAAELDATAAPVVVGEDVMAKAWRNLYISRRTEEYRGVETTYEMARARAEADANNFEDEFREQMAKRALTAALAGEG